MVRDWKETYRAYEEGRMMCNACGRAVKLFVDCKCGNGNGKTSVCPEGCLVIMDERRLGRDICRHCGEEITWEGPDKRFKWDGFWYHTSALTDEYDGECGKAEASAGILRIWDERPL